MQLQVSTTIRSMKSGSIKTIRQFVILCDKATNDEIFFMFEEGPCTEELKCQIYQLVPAEVNEPFRAAMDFLGFPNY